jgi:hypothetical protein
LRFETDDSGQFSVRRLMDKNPLWFDNIFHKDLGPIPFIFAVSAYIPHRRRTMIKRVVNTCD